MIDVEEDSPQLNNNINLAVKRAGGEIPGTAETSTFKAGESTMILESDWISCFMFACVAESPVRPFTLPLMFWKWVGKGGREKMR